MMKSICKITKKEKGTGFFCKIPFPDECQLLKVLITNNHVLGEKDIIDGNIIPISLNNDIINLEIHINNSRKTYTNPLYDITIIEIIPSDNITEFLFLDIDYQIYLKDDPNKIFHQNSIYLLHYPSDNIEYSIGVIKSISLDENNNIQHLFNTEPGSSGSPIINLNNYKVIGIHKGCKQGGQNWNLGTFIKKPIDEFNNIFKPDIILNGNKINNELKEYKESNISKWNTENVTRMDGMFCQCNSLISFPDISGWNTKNVTDISVMFADCKNLPYRPNISNWNIDKVTNKEGIFQNCSQSQNNIKNCFII